MATSATVELKNTTQGQQLQLQSGFECIFVKDPPEHLQTECSICLCVLREPYLLDCCGYSFCKSCIEPIKAERKPCPLCAVQFTRYMPDKRLQRTLNDLQVYCAHKDEGCEWVGRLANVAQHLNVNPLLERKRLSGCQLTSLDCKHCGECFQRRELLNHETSVCSQRPYSCEYCQDFNSTFKDVTSNHWSVCPDRPVPCPNGCGSSPELKQLKDHLKECPLEMIECPFCYSGCSEKHPRKEMPKHITQSIATHMSLQATSHQRAQQKLHHQISELQKLHQQEVMKLHLRISELETQLSRATKAQEQSKLDVAALRSENQLLLGKVQQECRVQVAASSKEIKRAQDQRLKGHLSTLRGEIKTAQAETKEEITTQVNSDIAAVHSHIGLVPFSVTMPDFEQKKHKKRSWYSPSFYTHPHGYKMCLRVDANGCDESANSHVSIYVYMMKGEYDEWLKWPFRGDITIQLLNQVKGDELHYARIIGVTGRNVFGRRILIEGGNDDDGLGFSKFIPHKDLTPYYLKYDCLQLCVKEVVIKSV